MSVDENFDKLLEAIGEIRNLDPSVSTLLWKTLSKSSAILPEDTMRKFHNELDWTFIVQHYLLSDNFIREFIFKLDNHDKWCYLCKYQKLSEDFMRDYEHRLDWSNICEYQILSEDFMREMSERLGWYYVSCYQKLSEDFIREFKGHVAWEAIVSNQDVSEDFIEEHLSEFSSMSQVLDSVFKYCKVSEDFIREHFDTVYSSDEPTLISSSPYDEVKCCPEDTFGLKRLSPPNRKIVLILSNKKYNVNKRIIDKVRAEKDEEARIKAENEKNDEEKKEEIEAEEMRTLRDENFDNNLEGVEI